MKKHRFARLCVAAALVIGVAIAAALPALAGEREFSVWNTGPDVITVQIPAGVAGKDAVSTPVSSHEFKRFRITDGPFVLTIKGPKYGPGACAQVTKEIPAGKNVKYSDSCRVELT